ncbi:MAG: DUF6291 domain-containing protein [Ruminococcus sp.]|nr:DUF6291 domain-containing protein [Ruminococcus sp.]
MSQTNTKKKNYHTDNNSFMLYKDWERYFDMLSDSETAQLVKGLFAYAARGEKVQLEGMSAMAYEFMTAAIERDGEKWETMCSKNSENGKKGGRPKANGFQQNPTEPKKADTDKDKDTDTDKEKVRHYGKYRNVSLTDIQHKKLVGSSSSSQTDKYIEKLSKWLKRQGKTCEDCFSVISQWIEEDKASSEVSASPHTGDLSDSGSSYDLDEFERYAMNFSLSAKNRPKP